MADLSKHDVLLNDISHIETRISVLVNNLKESLELNKKAEEQLNELKKENSELRQKLSDLEEGAYMSDTDSFGSLNSKEKETLKLKLQNLLSKIDYHLSS